MEKDYFEKKIKDKNLFRYEKEKRIYELIEQREKFLLNENGNENENNINEEINSKAKILGLDDEKKKKEYREIFCSTEGFKYILKHKGFDPENAIIKLEKAVCDLSEFATIFHDYFTFPQIRYIMYQILEGLIKLHNLSYDINIFHNDLKTENVFVIINNGNMKNEFLKILENKKRKEKYFEGISNINKSNINEFLQNLLRECTFKIGDFDLSNIISNELKDIDFIPGPIEDIIDVDKEDCYELGCIFYYLKTGNYFHYVPNHNVVIFKNPSFNSKQNLTRNYLKLLNKMLQVDRNFRLNCYDILSEDFFKIDNIKNVDLLTTKMKDDEDFIKFKDIYDIYLDNNKENFYLPIEDRGTFKLKNENIKYQKNILIGESFDLSVKKKK